MAYRLGVDVGGTFTDLLLIEEATGKTYRSKVPSTPSDPSQAVINGTARICDMADIKASDLSLVHARHDGCDQCYFGKQNRPRGFDRHRRLSAGFTDCPLPGCRVVWLAWIIWDRPPILAPLEATVEVKERLDSDGNVLKKVKEKNVLKAIKRLKKEKVEAVTICLINSFANSTHEKEIEAIVKREMPGVPVSVISAISCRKNKNTNVP